MFTKKKGGYTKQKANKHPSKKATKKETKGNRMKMYIKTMTISKEQNN